VNRIVAPAPRALDRATRAAFYDLALEALEQLGTLQPGQLVIDMRGTEKVDSSGLSTLILIQVRAAERKHSVGLLGISEEIRFLLLMTRLEDRFDLNPQV
jgi:anti-anti-sigma factor